MKVNFYTAKGGYSTITLDTPIVMKASYIESLIAQHYGRNIELRSLFWEGEYVNDSYKMLGIDYTFELACDYELDGETEIAEQMMIVLDFLKKIIPNSYDYDYILVDVSW